MHKEEIEDTRVEGGTKVKCSWGCQRTQIIIYGKWIKEEEKRGGIWGLTMVVSY